MLGMHSVVLEVRTDIEQEVTACPSGSAFRGFANVESEFDYITGRLLSAFALCLTAGLLTASHQMIASVDPRADAME